MKNSDKLTQVRRDFGGCWPNGNQELLLQACLLQEAKAIDAWRQWKANVDFNQVDPASNRLFPLLFSNLRAHEVEDPLLKIFEWVYIVNRAKTQRILQDMSDLLRVLHNAGIRTMILKGAALALLHYKDCGLRPIGDLDVLVPTEQAPDSIQILQQLGWTPMETVLKGFAEISLLKKFGWDPKPRRIESFTDTYLAARHAHDFLDSEGHVCDLHWHLLHGCNNPRADQRFWEEALEIKVCGVPTHALNATDQLFHACIYGVKWEPMPPIRWVADAYTIVSNSDNEINWDRLVGLAKSTKSVLPLQAALEYLQALLGVAIPLYIMRELRSLPVSELEKMQHRIRTRPPRVVDGLLEVYLVSRCCFKGMRDKHLSQRIAALPGLLQHVFGMDHISQLPFYVLFEFVRRTNKMLHRKSRGK
ncbi:MAG: nucleotidyltransferase family protein [Desulfoferrobacter sp.]